MFIVSSIPCLLYIVAFSGQMAVVVDGFGVQPKGSLSSLLSENSRGTTSSSLRYQNEESTITTTTTTTTTTSFTQTSFNNYNNYNNNSKNSEKYKKKKRSSINNKKKNYNNGDGWDLREDWALQDSVPRYTVGTDASTFWTQLRHSTPELGKRTEQELENRYKSWYREAEDSLLVECGTSPTLLSNWWVSTAGPTSKMMMGGSLLLPNGSSSQIWFPLQCAGTLGDDPISTSPESITQDTLDDCFISASMTMHTSFYAESIGGIVYELGAPRGNSNNNSNNNIGASTAPSTTHNKSGVQQQQGELVVLGDHLDKLCKNWVSIVSMARL